MMAISEQEQTALVPTNGARPNGHSAASNGNGNGHKRTALVVAAPAQRDEAREGNRLLKTDEAQEKQGAVEFERIGWRGWWRTLQVVRVMWLLSFYLFLGN